MSTGPRPLGRRIKASLRYRRGVAHRALRQRSPGVSRWMVRIADRGRGGWWRVRPFESNRPLERILGAFATVVPEATFIQIGAHDGTKLDPLRPIVLAGRWRGIMVEPVPYVFARLHERYGGNDRLILENVAVAETPGTADFFYVPESDGLWHSYDALGSFRREVVASHTHLIPDIEDRVVSAEVECITVDQLCDRNGFDTIDMVQIDTEGYDLHVLRMLDLERRRPRVVVFEHLHLTSDERDEAEERFTSAGYRFVSDGMDTIAVHGDVFALAPVAARFAEATSALREFER